MDCQGQVRIHINLLRPIQMVLSSRPASIFDVVGGEKYHTEEDDTGDLWPEEDTSPVTPISNDPLCEPPRSAVTAKAPEFSAHDQIAFDSQKGVNVVKRTVSKRAPARISTFHLPRGSTKLLHVRL